MFRRLHPLKYVNGLGEAVQRLRVHLCEDVLILYCFQSSDEKRHQKEKIFLNHLVSSPAAFWTDARFDKSSNKKNIRVIPVTSFNSLMAAWAFSSERHAIYTLAPCCRTTFENWYFSYKQRPFRYGSKWNIKKHTLAVSFPMPVFPPVITTTLSVRSGTSSSLNFCSGGYVWSMKAFSKSNFDIIITEFNLAFHSLQGFYISDPKLWTVE